MRGNVRPSPSAPAKQSRTLLQRQLGSFGKRLLTTAQNTTGFVAASSKRFDLTRFRSIVCSLLLGGTARNTGLTGCRLTCGRCPVLRRRAACRESQAKSLLADGTTFCHFDPANHPIQLLPPTTQLLQHERRGLKYTIWLGLGPGDHITLPVVQPHLLRESSSSLGASHTSFHRSSQRAVFSHPSHYTV